MTLIEQAVFTSARTERADGYQLVARSPGVLDQDARELAVWGPSHGELTDDSSAAGSFNFHPLPSGTYCVSRTSASGWEYSGRGGIRVYTQCLVVPPDVLARFANNPFALLRAALAAGMLVTYEEVPAELAPFQLSGRSPAVDATLLARLVANPGVDWLATSVQAALRSASLALVGGPPAECLIAGLLNCLPPECRTAFSFSTGLRYSSCRPFRLVAMPPDPAMARRMQRQYGLSVLEFAGNPPPEFAPIDGWAQFVHRVLGSGHMSFLATQFSKRRFELTPADLPALGLQLLEEWDDSSRPRTQEECKPTGGARTQAIASGDWQESLQRAHTAHMKFMGSNLAPSGLKEELACSPKQPDPASPEVLEKLELLDDLVFGAIGGKQAALEQLRQVWPDVRSALGEDLLADSREQYLRRALLLWENAVDPDGVRNPANAMQALDVLCVLFDDA